MRGIHLQLRLHPVGFRLGHRGFHQDAAEDIEIGCQIGVADGIGQLQRLRQAHAQQTLFGNPRAVL
ncbi:hypothetical protein D3C78_1227130 [compost metagenome]